MRAAMDDPMRVKLFIFTVQALIRPTSTTGRRTHKFQEGLGEAFYKHLRDLSDLVVFADEHHVYYGKAFSQAVPGLNHYALIGLTATPHKQTPQDQIVYSYPLAAAIANQYVKRPRQSWSRQPSYLRSGRGPSQCGTSTRLYAAEHGRRQRYESTVLPDYPRRQQHDLLIVSVEILSQLNGQTNSLPGVVLRSSRSFGWRWSDDRDYHIQRERFLCP